MLPEDNSSVRIATQFVKTLHPEVRADERIDLRYKKPGDSGTMSRVFVPDAEQAAELAVSYGRTYDVYAGVATRRGENGTKPGVCRTQAVWADLDAKDGHTRQSWLKQLLDLPCHPSMLVWTGGGWHAYWVVVRPVESPEQLYQAELVMRRLAVGLGSDPVHDRSRIMRVPGTFNHKYGERRPVELELYDPDRRYEFDQLQEMAESLPGTLSVDNGAGKVPREVLAEPVREGHRNVSLASIAGSLRDRGLDVETISVVLLKVNRLRCMPPLGDEEVLGIARSIGRYPAGKPRYGRSPVRRVNSNRKER